MSDKKKVIIIGGGTISHVRNHLALCMPAFGQTAFDLETEATSFFNKMEVESFLTRMAGGNADLETNEDVARLVDKLIADLSVKVIFFNVALCDFSGTVDDVPSGKYAERLSSSAPVTMDLQPQDKIIGKIRKVRKDIFLVGFKTTCGATEDEQYIAGLNLLKSASCNLVLANDTKTRTNMIITPEEARYEVTQDRDYAIETLVEMAWFRSHLTFTRSTVVEGHPIPWSSDLIPANLRAVVDHCIKRGAYKPFRGATVGHFAAKLDSNTFLTSIRKSNFNDIDKLGLVMIKTDGPDSVLAFGAKPSVGGQSQRIVFSEHPEYDCIVHFHCPIKEGSTVPQVSQYEYECGSHECGQNTSKGLAKFELWESGLDFYFISAVYLKNHGPNIVFNRHTPAHIITAFIEANFDLEGKTGGYVGRQSLQASIGLNP